MGGYFFGYVSIAGIQINKNELKSLLTQIADRNINLLYDNDENMYYETESNDIDEINDDNDRRYYRKPEKLLQKFKNPEWGLDFYCIQQDVYERAEHDIAPEFNSCKYIVGVELTKKDEIQKSDFSVLIDCLKTVGDKVKEVYGLEGDAKIYSGIKTYF